ncbi:hypothetical protein [Aureispira sp. CCB-E]|uniref:hypothetical protein n=1 Tax=Aureispira sp. CCB-E TaxID=3051121 RepID=UPI002868DC03|nr:hypothetical protein [Aureispira sp. CCB-E]WMX17203.1 hypothetical protein QP953_12545 [Aureispira sp. CCB-E]
MSDIHVEQLDAVIKAYKSKKRLKRHGNVVTKELFEMGLGFYKFPDGKYEKIEKIGSFEKLAELKSTHDTALIKLQRHQVQAFADYLALQDDPLYKKGFAALEDIKSKKDVGNLTIEAEAALAASAEFQVSWNKGVVGEAKLKAGVSMALDGKYAKLSLGASIALNVKAELKLNSVSLSATAEAAVEATLKSKPISIGKTTYSASFYTQFKAYAKAEARLDASVGLSATTFVAADAKGKLFAGVGVSGEVGIELNGVYNKKVNPNNRLLAKANLNATLEAGALISFGGEYGSESSEKIDGVDFSKKTFKVAAGMVAGAEFSVNILVLAEVTEDIKEAIKKKAKELIAELIGAEMMKYLEKKYAAFKKKADNVIHYIGHSIYNQFNSDSYTGLYYTMDSSIRRLEVHINRLAKDPNSQKYAEKARVRLEKVENKLIKYKVRIEGVRDDCGRVMYNVAELLANGDIDKKTFITRSSIILNEVEDAKDKVATMLSAIENVTEANLEMIDIENMLDDHLKGEDLLTSKDDILLENRRKMNQLLHAQTYMHDSLDYITEELTHKLVEEMKKRG